MDPRLNHLFHRARSIRLDDAVRSRIRARLEARMRLHPVAAGIPSPYAAFFGFAHAPRAIALALIIVLVFGGSGITFAAEGALPGDALYPVKVTVTEPARGILAIGTEAEAAWETERAERRLEETEALVANRALNEEAGVELEAAFSEAAEEAASHIEKLADSNPVEAAEKSAEFEAMLIAHGRILSDIVDARAEAREAASPVLTRLALRAERTGETRRSLETEAIETEEEEAAEEAGNRALARAERDASKWNRSYSETGRTDDEETATALAERTDAINAAVEEGKANHAVGDYRTAFERAQRARELIGVSERLVKAKERYEWRGESRGWNGWSGREEEDVPQDARMAKTAPEGESADTSVMMSMSFSASVATTAETGEDTIAEEDEGDEDGAESDRRRQWWNDSGEEEREDEGIRIHLDL